MCLQAYSLNWNVVQRSQFLSGSWDDTVRLWDLARPNSLACFREHTYCVYAAVWCVALCMWSAPRLWMTKVDVPVEEKALPESISLSEDQCGHVAIWWLGTALAGQMCMLYAQLPFVACLNCFSVSCRLAFGSNCPCRYEDVFDILLPTAALVLLVLV